MAFSDSSKADSPHERNAKIVVPLIGTAFAFMAAMLSAYIAVTTADKSAEIQKLLGDIQQSQYAQERATKSEQFNRDDERQYIALVYTDLVSKDASRQSAALSLLVLLVPRTGGKLLDWAKTSRRILPENRTQSEAVAQRLQINEANSRLRIYLHLGTSNGRPVSEQSEILRSLKEQGFFVTGSDGQSDTSGPVIDYFRDSDKGSAEAIAKIMADLLPQGAQTFKIRKQNISNPGAIGIWF